MSTCETDRLNGLPLLSLNMALLSVYSEERFWLQPYYPDAAEPREAKYDLISVELPPDANFRMTLHNYIKSTILRGWIDRGFLGTAWAVGIDPDPTLETPQYRKTCRMFFSATVPHIPGEQLLSLGLVPFTAGKIRRLDKNRLRRTNVKKAIAAHDQKISVRDKGLYKAFSETRPTDDEVVASFMVECPWIYPLAMSDNIKDW